VAVCPESRAGIDAGPYGEGGGEESVERLKAEIRRLRGRPGGVGRPAGGVPPREPVDLRPTNAFEVAIAERMKAMEEEIGELRSRINWLLTVIVGAAVTNIVIALLK